MPPHTPPRGVSCEGAGGEEEVKVPYRGLRGEREMVHLESPRKTPEGLDGHIRSVFKENVRQIAPAHDCPQGGLRMEDHQRKTN